MRYSEAIKLGGMLAPKCRWKFYDEKTGAMCVQGAALNAVGELNKTQAPIFSGSENHRLMKQTWPEACQTKVELGDIPYVARAYFVRAAIRRPNSQTIRGVSITLNNYTHWTREQIADWVAKMEVKYGLVEEEPVTNVEPSHKEAMCMVGQGA